MSILPVRTSDFRNVSMIHMVNPSRFSPNVQKYCVEGRNRDTGWMDCSIPLPFNSATERQLTDHYFRNNPGPSSASQEEICKWYNDRGIYFRPKTW